MLLGSALSEDVTAHHATAAAVGSGAAATAAEAAENFHASHYYRTNSF